MALKVHLYRLDFLDYSNEFKSLMEPDISITNGSSIPSDAEYEVLVHPTPSKEWLEASPNLKAVAIPWAGIPEKTREVFSDYPNISLHNLHHNNYNTAELGFALLLAAAKYVIPFDQKLRKNDWRAHAGMDPFRSRPVIMMVVNTQSKATIALSAKPVQRWIQVGCIHRKPYRRKIALFGLEQIPFGILHFGVTNILPSTGITSCGGKLGCR